MLTLTRKVVIYNKLGHNPASNCLSNLYLYIMVLPTPKVVKESSFPPKLDSNCRVILCQCKQIKNDCVLNIETVTAAGTICENSVAFSVEYFL